MGPRMGSRKSLNQALFWQFAHRWQSEMSTTARALHLKRPELRTLILLFIFLLEIRNTIRLHVA